LLAAAGGHVEVCEILLLQGVDVSAADNVSSVVYILFSRRAAKTIGISNDRVKSVDRLCSA